MEPNSKPPIILGNTHISGKPPPHSGTIITLRRRFLPVLAEGVGVELEGLTEDCLLMLSRLFHDCVGGVDICSSFVMTQGDLAHGHLGQEPLAFSGLAMSFSAAVHKNGP